jgi:hypothetical protein
MRVAVLGLTHDHIWSNLRNLANVAGAEIVAAAEPDRSCASGSHPSTARIGAKRSKNPRVEIADESRNAQKWHLTALPLNQGSPETACHTLFSFRRDAQAPQGALREVAQSVSSNETTERSSATVKKTPSLDLVVTFRWQGSQWILYGREIGGA